MVDIGGKVKSDRLIGIGSAVYLDEAIELLEINSHIKVEFEAGNCVELKGKNRLYVDKSVASTKVDGLSSIIKERFALKQAVDVPLDRPFYINVGSESLIAPSSKELELREDGVYIGISQFYVQEEYELSFADEKPKEGVVKFRGEIEEYEILNSNIFKDSIIINDLVYGRDGGRVVYPDVKVLEFLNAKVDLCYTQEGRESIKLGNLIKLDDEKGEFDGVSITIKRHTQGRDYLLFDKNLVPKDVRFSYMIDDELIVLKFFGKSKHYVDLLKSLCHESGSLNTLHVQVEAGFKGAKICLFDGLI